MYHSISNDNENTVHPYYRINTSPEVFTEHMRYLHDNNYSIVSLHDIKELLGQSSVTAKKYVIITFDDGYRDFYAEAFPILQKYGFTATVFLPTAFINNPKITLKGKQHLNWDEVKELSQKKITFGSHTVTHPQLKFLKKEDIEFELRQSKETIEDTLGIPVESFSYPFAFLEDKNYKEYLKKILQKLGYKYGVSTRIGQTSEQDEIYFMKRIPVNSCDDILFFQAKIRGGYDWLNAPQNFFKILKHRFSGDRDV